MAVTGLRLQPHHVLLRKGAKCRLTPRQPCRGSRLGLCLERGLIRGEYPSIADRCPNRSQRRGERPECGVRLRRPNPGPFSERCSRSWTENVQVSAREFKTCMLWVHIGWRHRPNHGLARSVPMQEDCACGSSISKAVVLHAHREPRLAKGHSLPIESRVEPVRGALCSRPANSVFRQTPE